MKEKGIFHIGMGVSGGEEGARNGAHWLHTNRVHHGCCVQPRLPIQGAPCSPLHHTALLPCPPAHCAPRCNHPAALQAPP